MPDKRKARLIRISPALDQALERSAAKDARSVNTFIERILIREMKRTGEIPED